MQHDNSFCSNLILLGVVLLLRHRKKLNILNKYVFLVCRIKILIPIVAGKLNPLNGQQERKQASEEDETQHNQI